MNEISKALLISVFWYSIGILKTFQQLSAEQRKEVARRAGDALAFDADLAMGKGKVKIPYFGECSGVKCTAIIASYAVSEAPTDHLDSEILDQARAAKKFECFPDN